MVDLKALAEECDTIAASKGFERPSWDNIIVKLALAGTELDEARDGALGCGEDPLAEELADTAIRLLSILYGIWGRDWNDRVTGRHDKPISTYAPIETLLWPTLGYLFKAMEARRKDDRVTVVQCVELAVLEVFRLADALSIDLLAQIGAKCEKNRARPYLHGKGYAPG